MFYIIMPVYNTEKYLREAIDSIVNQNLSFSDHIMLHLLDDASSDHSLQICEEYKEKYPDNIIVTHFEENHGVSYVRNYALKHRELTPDMIAGFVDSDDKLAADMLEKAKQFFETYDDINIAAAEIHYFGKREDENKLNWRFEKKEIVDIDNDYTYPQYYIGGVFLRRKALEQIVFDETMSFWEDALAVNQVILQEGKYGLIRAGIYWYRKREDESSLVDQSWRDPNRYRDFLDMGYMCLLRYSKKQKRKVIPYVQFVVAYHLRLFMMKSNSEIVDEMISQQDLADFRKRVRKILKMIKPDVIARIPVTLPVLEEMMSIRRGRTVRARRTYTENDCIFSFRGIELTRMSERKVRLLHIMETSVKYKGMWKGRFDTPVYQMAKSDYIFAVHGGERVDSVRISCDRELYILGDKMRNYRYAGFAIAIPEHWEYATFGIHTNGIDILMNEVVFAEILERNRLRKEEQEEQEE